MNWWQALAVKLLDGVLDFVKRHPWLSLLIAAVVLFGPALLAWFGWLAGLYRIARKVRDLFDDAVDALKKALGVQGYWLNDLCLWVVALLFPPVGIVLWLSRSMGDSLDGHEAQQTNMESQADADKAKDVYLLG